MALTEEKEQKRDEQDSEEFPPLDFHSHLDFFKNFVVKVFVPCAPFMAFEFWALPSMSHDTHGWQWWVLLFVTICATGAIVGGFFECLSEWVRG
jgi:hypothetical protein